MYEPKKEALKEIARWGVFFILSWVITETLKQISLIPEIFPVKVWVITYAIPVRSLATFALTMAGRYTDKYLHVQSKLEGSYPEGKAPSMGLLKF